MTILFLGNFRVSYCSEVHYKKTFEKLGHTVIPIQESEATGNDIVSHANIDMFFWVHTHSWPTKNIDEALTELRARKVPIVAFHLDLYMGLEREPQIKDYVTKVDHFFTVDKLMADYLNEHTQTKGHYLPAGCFEDECYMAEPNREKYPHDIVFTGSKNYHKEYPYRSKLIDWLHATYGDRFAHFGGGGKPTLRGHELNVMYASAKISIGDTLCKDFSYEWYTSDRLFESCGRGSFLIYPKIYGLDSFYEDKKEVVYYDFNNFEQLKELIDYYLIYTDQREEIRLAGHNRTKSYHTYTHRIQSLLSILNLK